MEWWRTGVVENWSGGELEWWRTGVVENWSGGELEWWRTGVVENWSGGVLFANAQSILHYSTTPALQSPP
jgi:hypothetical protein